MLASTMDCLNLLDYVFGILAVLLTIRAFQGQKHTARLPPGPRGLPLICNLLDLPKGFEPPHWASHKARYGPISSVSVLGTCYIIVNDAKIAFELLDKRSIRYSGRPRFEFGGEMVGFSGSTTLSQYGPLLRLHRKEMARVIGPTAISRYTHLEEVEARRFLLRLLNEPDKLAQHTRTTAGAIILKISHGYTINASESDPFIDLANRVLDIFSRVLTPGASLVDVFPLMKVLPEWLPGAGFKKVARNFAKEIDEFIDKPFAFVRHQIALGTARPSLASSLIERNASDDYQMKWIASTLYGGGADTTVSAVMTFFLAMVIHPEVLAKAQEELDYVIGRDRLPGLDDRIQLPYIEALEKETLRWNNVVPMCVPHALSEDDTYMGYTLPKGAIILPNIWQMTHDDSVYPDPFSFTPERFLGPNAQHDPRELVFGFGRRICPGRELADGSLFLSIAMTVATFDIGRARDEAGHEIIPVNECLPGIISHPKPFKYSLTPRDDRAVALIRSILDEYPFEKSDADVLKKL